MPGRIALIAILLLGSRWCAAQGSVAVDLLNPQETSGTIPSNFRIVDVFANLPMFDPWTAAGIRATTENGAALNYFDADPNTPGIQPGLFNGGVQNKFYTMLSKPRPRDANYRFTDAHAAAAGAYDPPGPSALKLPGELNVAYFHTPPDTEFALDGYIARISVDISAVSEFPGYPINDYANWGAAPIDAVPLAAVIVLRSEPQITDFGTAMATFDYPQLTGLNWAMYYIPEPATLMLLTIGGAARLRRR
jgi:hypothetical protein